MLVGSSNFLVPNGTFIVELVAFLIVVLVMAKYVLPPINKVMDERQQTIRQALADADAARQQAAEAEEERRSVVSEARSQARAVVEEANRQAEQARAERRSQAEAEYQRIVGSAHAEIDAQARRAQEDLRQQAADLAIAAAEKILGEGIDRDAQAGLINRTIDEVAGATPAEQGAPKETV